MTDIVNQFIVDQGYNRGRNRHMVDPSVSGQYGTVPDHRVWANQTPYVSNAVIARVIRGPRGFADLPESEKWYAALKAIVERHTRTISGLDSTLQVEVRDTPWGFAGEMFEVDTNVTRNRSQVQLGLGAELYGMPMQAFVDGWITNLIRNPDSKYADVSTLSENLRPSDLLADYKGAMILYFEPDPLMRKVVKAWLQFNCWPKEGLPLIGAADKASGGELQEATLNLTGTTMTSTGIMRFAQRFLNNMPIVGSSTYLAPSIVDSVAADILAARVGDEDNLRRAIASAEAL